MIVRVKLGQRSTARYVAWYNRFNKIEIQLVLTANFLELEFTWSFPTNNIVFFSLHAVVSLHFWINQAIMDLDKHFTCITPFDVAKLTQTT